MLNLQKTAPTTAATTYYEPWRTYLGMSQPFGQPSFAAARFAAQNDVASQLEQHFMSGIANIAVVHQFKLVPQSCPWFRCS